MSLPCTTRTCNASFEDWCDCPFHQEEMASVAGIEPAIFGFARRRVIRCATPIERGRGEQDFHLDSPQAGQGDFLPPTAVES